MNVEEFHQQHISDRVSDLGKAPKRTSKIEGFNESSKTSPASDEIQTPRLVLANPSIVSPARDFDYCHKSTDAHRALNSISPYEPKGLSTKYSLNNGVFERNAPSGLEKENISSSEMKVRQGILPSRKSSGGRLPSSIINGSSNRKGASHVIDHNGNKLLSSCRRKQDQNSYKIFLLLLQPRLKTFELIQLIYYPTNTTIGNILSMIPENATEPALGSQIYTGLCRPKTEEEIMNHELLASESRTSKGADSAKITLGEILVAIPDGYDGAGVAILARQILSNPKIVKLLQRSDPLAPKKSRRSSRRGLRKGSRRSRSKEHVEVMEKFDEEDEIKQEQEKKEQEQRMQEAMEHAAQEAAASNAQIPGRAGANFPKTSVRNISHPSSIVSLDGGSLGEEKSTESSLQESIDESFSSWSKSFDASFASSVCSGASKRSVRRRDRQSRRMKIIHMSVATVFVLMLVMYFVDPHGYRRSDEEKQVSQAATTENPMGLTGIFQCLFLLLSLYQVELFVRTTSRTTSRDKNTQSQSSFLEFIKSTRAMKKLKSRFYKKIKRPSTRTRGGAVGAYDYDENTLTQKLRSFSLKGNNNIRANNIDESDTGSL